MWKNTNKPAVWLTEEELWDAMTHPDMGIPKVMLVNATLTAKFGNPDDLVSKRAVARAVYDNDYMWDDLAELGITPELEKESNECNER